jgi:hypothetical protein
MTHTLNDGHTAYEVAVHFTCSELDSLAKLLWDAGEHEAALLWISAHKDNPDEEVGDAHYRRDPQKYLDAMVGKEVESTLYDHDVRPCDCSQSACSGCCKECQEPITWMGCPGPWSGNEYAHGDES